MPSIEPVPTPSWNSISGLSPGFPVIQLQVHSRLQQCLQPFTGQWQLIETHQPIDAFQSSAAPHFMHLCCGSKHQSKQSMTANYVTEAPYFEALGVPTVVLGPGSIQQAHQANEWLSLEQFDQGHKVYRSLLEHFCYS